MIREFGVEEIVGETVHHQDRVTRAVGGVVVGVAPAHQRRHELALAVGVGAEFEGPLPVSGQHVGLPSRHGCHPNAESG